MHKSSAPTYSNVGICNALKLNQAEMELEAI